MVDWQKLVSQRLSGLALAAAEREEVYAELAEHLAESYEGFCKQGMLEKEAAFCVMIRLSPRSTFFPYTSPFRSTQDLMQNRLHQLWIPGFLTLTLSTIFLMILQRLGFQPPSVSWSGPGTILFYGPWLLSLIVFGAVAACLSSRAGGSRATVLLASVFPVPALTAAFLSMFPI